MQEGKTRLYAGLYIRTRKQTRFWGWGSNGWGRSKWGSWKSGSWKSESLCAAEVERPWAGLAEWLRLAHARLDRNAAELPAPADAQIEASRTHGAPQQDVSRTATLESKN
jgi:hypothetical protein